MSVSRHPTPITAKRPPNTLTKIRAMLLECQDLHFEALAEWLYAQGYLAGAAEADDRETAIETRVFERMTRCACACCRLNLPELLEADRHDHAERYAGHALAAVRLDAGAAYIRGSSTRVEAGRTRILAAARGEGA